LFYNKSVRFEGLEADKIELIRNYEDRKDSLAEMERDLIDLGLKSALMPREVEDEDIEQVRRHDVTDNQLVELISTALIAYNLAAVNQVFNLVEGADS